MSDSRTLIASRDPGVDQVRTASSFAGDRLRQVREARGLTQRALADRLVQLARTNRKVEAGVSPDMISKWERDQKRPSSLYQQLLPLALDTSPIDLGLLTVGDAAPADHSADVRDIENLESEPVDRRTFLRGSAALSASTLLPESLWPKTGLKYSGASLVAPIRRAMFSPVVELRDGTSNTLGRRVKAAWRLRQEGRYEALADMLPALILDARAVAQTARAKDQISAATVLVHTYNATSSALKILGNTPLALLAADRASESAASVMEPTLTASAAYRLANVFLPANQFAEASEVARQAAEQLESTIDQSIIGLAIWGSLTLTAAAAAAQSNDLADAWQLLGEATRASKSLGHDHADLHTIFGPTSVNMAAVQIAVELGDGKKALRRSSEVIADKLPPSLKERRAHHLMHVARAHALLHHDASAVTTLLDAERCAPGDVRRSSISRDLVFDLLKRERRGAAPGLRELADRLAIPA